MDDKKQLKLLFHHNPCALRERALYYVSAHLTF